MHEGGGCADVSPSTSSLLALKPRQVLLVELQRNLAEAMATERKRSENSAQPKSEEESVLICSIALWLENKGLLKVLKRFVFATQIQDHEWKARALNLNKIFSNYLDSCNNTNKDNTTKQLEKQGAAASAEQLGGGCCAVSEGIASEKKKNKNGDAPAINSERTSEDVAIREKANDSILKLEQEKNCKKNGALSHGEQKSKIFNESTTERVCGLTLELGDESVKKQKDKKKNNKSESTITDEKLLNAIPEMTKGKQKDLPSVASNDVHDSEVMVETKDKTKKKKRKTDDKNNKVFYDENAEALDSEKPIDITFKKKSVEATGVAVKESKKSSKKRKGLASDENEELPILNAVVGGSKRRKTDSVEIQITLPGANGHADSHKQTGEIHDRDPTNGAEKLSQPKSSTKQHKNSVEPKTVNAFQRVKIDEVEFVDERLQDNSYWAKNGAESGCGAKAQETLGQFKGREEHGENEKDEEVEADGDSDSQSDADEDDDDLESVSEADERDDGDNNEPFRSHTIANAPKGTGTHSSMKLREDMEQDDEALFDTDEESDLVLNDQSLSEPCMTTSTFHSHVSYKLSSREVDELLKTKWSYTWKMPALSMKDCNWRGTGGCCIKDLDVTSYYGLKTKLYKNWMEIFKASGSSAFHQSKQKMFFSLCNSYCDIMHHNKKPFYLKGLEEDSNIMDGYLMHSLNHILRSRDLMSKNDRKLAKHQENVEGENLNAEAYLDRGFTRPKVLILLPLAGIARRVIKKLIQLTPPKLKDKVENIQRFYKEFGSGITKDNDDQDDSENTKTKMTTKPSDFEALLGRDNNNDHFMIGVKFTNRGIKLYGDFYTSDILVGSPLGLITKIGEAEVSKEKDVDYLSSIEILIIDHADVMLMQNWSHVKTIVEQLNQLPSKQRGTDIMRIRPWYLDGQARFYRQTIILSSHINPDFNALFHQHCFNHQGKVKLECKYRGVLPKILTQVQQIYERFDTESITEVDDSRLQYFSKKVFPKIKDSVQHGVMIFVSSYFEFVRLRNYLKSQAASFCLFGEYIKPNDISHVRGQFFRGEKRIMLYTERAHFYYRYKIRGVKNLLIYSLPERKEFYPEIVNFLEPSSDMTCTILFSRLDYLRLERVVGSTAAKRMVDSDKGVFVFA